MLAAERGGGAYQEPSWLFIPYIAHKKTANMFPFPLFNLAIHIHGMIMQDDTINYTPAPFPHPHPHPDRQSLQVLLLYTTTTGGSTRFSGAATAAAESNLL